MKLIDLYGGWKIYHFRCPTVANPRQGQTFECVDNYVARRCGVTMNTNSLEGIKKMVDYKNYCMMQWRKQGFYS